MPLAVNPIPATDFASLIQDVASTAVRSVAADPNVPTLSPVNTPDVLKAIADQVAVSPAVAATAAVVAEATTPVPWYKNTIMVSSLVSLIVAFMSVTYGVTVPQHVQTEVLAPGLVIVLSSLATIVTRLRSNIKPITK